MSEDQSIEKVGQTEQPLQKLDKSPLYKGRHRIYSDYEKVEATNVVAALNDTLSTFGVNAAEVQFLWDYYRGKQPILNREKEVRPEINNKIVVNHAQEIVAFKIGYQLAEPLQYTCRNYDNDSDDVEGNDLKQINELNTLMFAEDKASCDRDLFEWMCVCGIGFRMVESDTEDDWEDGGAPFEIYTLDPRNTYVVYSSAYHHRQLMSVWVGKDSVTEETIYNVYTDEKLFRIKGNQIVNGNGVGESHTYGRNPIIEYKLNNARMGVFEPVLPLLDAINAVESNRLDGIEQTVQALMKFVNCDIDEATFKAMVELGAVKVTTTEGVQSDVDIIKNDLDQTQTQVTKDDLYQAVVNICGMPNRNGTSGSSSDTGAAVLLRDGWTLAESHAKSYELQFKRSERDMLRVVLAICKQSNETEIDLRIRDIELAFNRRNYENILTKAQVLTTMLKEGKIHPELAFQACGMFTDPEAAYYQSKQYADEKAQNQPQFAPVVAGDDGNEGDPKVGSQAGTPELEEGDDAANVASA